MPSTTLITYTPPQLAKQWSCSDDHIRALIASGELEANNIGNGKRNAKWIITSDAADDFLRRRTNRRAVKKPKRKATVPHVTREWV